MGDVRVGGRWRADDGDLPPGPARRENSDHAPPLRFHVARSLHQHLHWLGDELRAPRGIPGNGDLLDARTGRGKKLAPAAMGYDKETVERVRRLLSVRRDVVETKMIGGLCFMVNGSMCCGISSTALMVRVGPDAYERALAEPHTRPMTLAGRSLAGYVTVARPATRPTRHSRRGSSGESTSCRRAALAPGYWGTYGRFLERRIRARAIIRTHDPA